MIGAEFVDVVESPAKGLWKTLKGRVGVKMQSVPDTPEFVNPPSSGDSQALFQHAASLTRMLYATLTAFGFRLNRVLPKDGSESMSGPLGLTGFTVATLPPASAHLNSVVAVVDEVGGHTIAFSDGTNWRRVQDRAVVS